MSALRSHPWRVGVEWLLTLAFAFAFMLAFQAEVAQSYLIPSASMEPTLHCAKPASGCLASFSDRVIACRLCYRIESPSRGQIVVFDSPPAAASACGEGGVYVKRLVGMPGETIYEDRASQIWVDGHRLAEPYITAAARSADAQFRARRWRVPAGATSCSGTAAATRATRAPGERCRGRISSARVIATYWPPLRLSP